MPDERDRPVVTPAMVGVGMQIYGSFDPFLDSPSEMLAAVYAAMQEMARQERIPVLSNTSASRPCLVTLESGIQAIIKIASFTYVEGVPIAIGGGFAEDIDPAELLERSPDGVRFKGVSTATNAGPVDVDSHGIHSFVVPKGD